MESSSLGLIPYLVLGYGQHQLNSVQLVYFRCTGIIVHGNDVRCRIMPLQLFDDTLSDNVVRETSERLGTYDIIYPFR